MNDPPAIHIHHVDTRRQVVVATSTTPAGKTHRVGHAPGLPGWWCLTCNTRTCPHIQPIRELTLGGDQ